MKRIDNKGFTIIELLISTVIFSVILLVITGAIIQFGRIYYRGVVQSKTQERSRAIIDSVAKDLQFSKPNSFSGAPGAGCYSIGNHSYVYTQDSLRIVEGDCSGTGGLQMLGERMRLITFDVAKDPVNSEAYNVHVRVVYGANDDFEKNNPSDTTGDPKKPCNPIIIGGQFCAVSELNTTVVSRLR
jgi:prepilin-type N-terminal cleavage/methylation domain-containing protein